MADNIELKEVGQDIINRTIIIFKTFLMVWNC